MRQRANISKPPKGQRGRSYHPSRSPTLFLIMKTPKPYQPMQAPEGAMFQPFEDQYGAPIGKLNIHVDGYEDNLQTVLNAPVYRDLAERLFAMLLVCADNNDPIWLSLKREAIEVLG